LKYSIQVTSLRRGVLGIAGIGLIAFAIAWFEHSGFVGLGKNLPALLLAGCGLSLLAVAIHEANMHAPAGPPLRTWLYGTGRINIVRPREELQRRLTRFLIRGQELSGLLKTSPSPEKVGSWQNATIELLNEALADPSIAACFSTLGQEANPRQSNVDLIEAVDGQVHYLMGLLDKIALLPINDGWGR
jgi:hypothetical protein